MVTNFFLGANSGAGFQNLYADFVNVRGNRDVMVLKGGPGVGKSSFMKYLGQKAEERGLDVEYIWCSGDPDSLDAVHLPQVGVIAVDGTAPHVIEPVYPAAVDRYVNLGCCYDVDALKEKRGEIQRYMGDYKAAYRRAYRALQTEQEVKNTAKEPDYHREKLLRRTRGIIRRELGKEGAGSGTVSKRFLGALTCRGEVRRFDTVDTLAERVYLLCGSETLAGELLGQVAAAAGERKYDLILCPDPENLERVQHLIIPQLSLAFLTEQEETPYPGRTYRRIHLDSLTIKEKEHRAKYRFYRRTVALLRQEGMEELGKAKALHDLLEQVYNPHVDFERVYAMAVEEWRRIEKLL